MSELSMFDRLMEEHRRKKAEQNPLLGYCPCCGFAHFRDKPEEHDYSCIWFKEKKDE